MFYRQTYIVIVSCFFYFVALLLFSFVETCVKHCIVTLVGTYIYLYKSETEWERENVEMIEFVKSNNAVSFEKLILHQRIFSEI